MILQHNPESVLRVLAVMTAIIIPPASSLAGDNAAVVASNLPSSLACGATYQASVTMRNTGTTAWTSDVFKLGPVGDSDDLNGPARIYLPNGASITMKFGEPETYYAATVTTAIAWCRLVRISHSAILYAAIGSAHSPTSAPRVRRPRALRSDRLPGRLYRFRIYARRGLAG